MIKLLRVDLNLSESSLVILCCMFPCYVKIRQGYWFRWYIYIFIYMFICDTYLYCIITRFSFWNLHWTARLRQSQHQGCNPLTVTGFCFNIPPGSGDGGRATMRSVVEILVPSKWQFPYAYRLYFRGRSSKIYKTINHKSPIHCKHGNIQLMFLSAILMLKFPLLSTKGLVYMIANVIVQSEYTVATYYRGSISI